MRGWLWVLLLVAAGWACLALWNRLPGMPELDADWQDAAWDMYDEIAAGPAD